MSRWLKLPIPLNLDKLSVSEKDDRLPVAVLDKPVKRLITDRKR